MKTPLIIFLIILIIVIWLRFVRWFFASRVERPTTDLITNYWEIQIRSMPEKIYASVVVHGEESQAPSKAFGILAGFIFGNNTTQSKVSMTAPVITQKTSETISMTTPVVSQKTSTWSYQVSFLMPKEYTIDTLPIPNDKRISITTIQSKNIAVITFSRYATQDTINTYRSKLLDWLKALNISTRGESVVAQYNDPWTPPMMRTNEIWIEIDKSSLPK